MYIVYRMIEKRAAWFYDAMNTGLKPKKAGTFRLVTTGPV